VVLVRDIGYQDALDVTEMRSMLPPFRTPKKQLGTHHNAKKNRRRLGEIGPYAHCSATAIPLRVPKSPSLI